jgi:hypothetical protein
MEKFKKNEKKCARRAAKFSNRMREVSSYKLKY